ncbi:MAG: hypothetical protein L0H84_10380 [Pseudonocardia sp.]|nr:hypothetical protein [Pseudonocardia sp.]
MGWRALIAAGLAAVAALATVVGGLLPLDSTGSGGRYVTAWTGFAADGASSGAGVPVYGIPLTIGALVLAAAAALLLRGGRRPALAAVTAGAGLVAGLVVAIRLAAAAAAFNTALLQARLPDIRAIDTAGAGAWVLGGAAVLAVGAAVIAPRSAGSAQGPPGGSRPAAALVGLLVAALLGTGSLLSVTVTTVDGEPPSAGYATAWGYTVASGTDAGATGQATTLTGIPLAVAVAALLVGSLVVLDMRGAERAAPFLTAAAGGIVGVLAATWTAWLALADAQATADIGISTTLGAGAWVLLAAALLAAALCANLWLRPARRRVPVPGP